MSFQEKYISSVVPALQKDLKLSSVMSIPKLEKIVLNIGIGSWLQGGKDFSKVLEGITAVSGQKPVVKTAKISVSNFKLRKGMPVGIMVTLRGKKMYDFLERLIKIVAPRIRDFDGFSKKSFDGRGNYSIGLDTYSVFPEIHYNDVVKNYGVAVTIVSSARKDDHAKALLDSFGFPFKK